MLFTYLATITLSHYEPGTLGCPLKSSFISSVLQKKKKKKGHEEK